MISMRLRRRLIYLWDILAPLLFSTTIALLATAVAGGAVIWLFFFVTSGHAS